MGVAAERWRGLVEGRLAEMERLQAGRGAVGREYWNSRAGRFASGPMATAEGDPMLSRLRRAVGRPGTSTFLDVGAGPGRFTLALAPRVARATAVDPSDKMLRMLRRSAREAGYANVRTVVGNWPEADVEPADVVLCSHVLPLIPDVVPFLAKLQAVARRRVVLYVGAFAADAILDPFWRHFHDQPRKPGASYVDAVKVIEEMGISPSVQVVELRSRTRWATVAEAVDSYRDMLVLPRTVAVHRELTRLLEPWLQPTPGGGYRPPFLSQPAAIVSWATAAS